MPEQNPIPGAVIAIQTFGDFLGFNPHCHVLVTDGCFYGRGIFRVAPPLDLKKLEAIFRHRVFKMLLAKRRITRDLIAMLSTWRHSGFQIFCGNRIGAKNETAMENLARQISRAFFSQERMQVISFIEDEKVIEKILKHLGLWDLKVRPPPAPKRVLINSIQFNENGHSAR